MIYDDVGEKLNKLCTSTEGTFKEPIVYSPEVETNEKKFFLVRLNYLGVFKQKTNSLSNIFIMKYS